MLNDLNPFLRYARIIDFDSRHSEVVSAVDCRLFYCLQNSFPMAYGGTEICLCRNQCLFVPPHVPYRLGPTATNGWASYADLNFDLTGEFHAFEGPYDSYPLGKESGYVFHAPAYPPFDTPVFINEAEDLLPDLRNILRLFLLHPPYYREYASMYLKNILLSILTREKQSVKNSAAVTAAVDYVIYHFRENISASHIARAIGYERSYLSNLMKRETGKTLGEFLNDYRLLIARKRLLDSNMSVGEIALRCGFQSISYFCNLFRKRCGVTPSDFRNQESFLSSSVMQTL